MSEHGRRSSRPLQASTPQASRMLQSSLRPSGFLNMLNPMMGRTYQGYLQANQSVLEEEEDEYENEERQLDNEIPYRDKSPFGESTDRRVSWGESSRMNVLHHKPQNEIRSESRESSDDEVPQSFMIETSPQTRLSSTPRRSKGKGKESKRSKKSSSKQPILPISNNDTLRLPPRPSDIEPSPDNDPRPETMRKPMRSLDAYERALWNWVNVYDLDIFLQDAYRYYEGKGIYSIALSRGLHLL